MSNDSNIMRGILSLIDASHINRNETDYPQNKWISIYLTYENKNIFENFIKILKLENTLDMGDYEFESVISFFYETKYIYIVIKEIKDKNNVTNVVVDFYKKSPAFYNVDECYFISVFQKYIDSCKTISIL